MPNRSGLSYENNPVHPEIKKWERDRFSFFVGETKDGKRAQDVIPTLDKIFPPPDVWYDLHPRREEQGNE